VRRRFSEPGWGSQWPRCLDYLDEVVKASAPILGTRIQAALEDPRSSMDRIMDMMLSDDPVDSRQQRPGETPKEGWVS
jgi:hypothetical protein